MFGFLKRKSNTSKNAKKRLKAVISRDRANVSAEFLMLLSNEIVAAAMKYIEPDQENISIFIDRSPCGSCLCARLPIVAYKKS